MNFENIILKNIIQSPNYYSKVRNILKPSVFTNLGNQEIFKIVSKYNSEYNKLPNETEILIQAKEIINPEIKKQIAEQILNIKNSEILDNKFLIDKTVDYVKNQIFMNAMLEGSNFIDKGSESSKQKCRDLIDEMYKVSIDTDFGLSFDDIEKRIDYYQNPETGINYKRFKELSSRLGSGFTNGTLSIFAAPAGIGKSLMLSTSLSDFFLQGKNVLLVSMEMSDFEFFKRIDADILDLNINDLKVLDKSIIKRKFDEIEKKGKIFVKQYSPGEFSANMLRSLLDTYETNNIKFDIVMLDYLGIMKSDKLSPSVGLYSYIKSISEEVRSVAVDYQIPIISCSQLNRSAVNNLNASNDSISDSLGTLMTCDFVCFLLQSEEMKAKSQLVFKITKNRFSGRTDHFQMNVDYSRMRVSDTVEPSSAEEAKKIEQYANDAATEIQNQMKQQNDEFWSF